MEGGREVGREGGTEGGRGLTINHDHHNRNDSPVNFCVCLDVSSSGRRGVEERNIKTNKLNTQTIRYD